MLISSLSMSSTMNRTPSLLRLAALLTAVYSIVLNCHALPMCINQEAPLILKTSLAFCSNFKQNDTSCCNSATDNQLKSKFQSFNVSDAQCASYLKQIVCAQCDPYAGSLFAQQDSSVPVLCNSTLSSAPETSNYCQNVWASCKNVPIKNSPFATKLQGATGSTPSNDVASKLADDWQSETPFCSSLGGVTEFCFSGTKFLPSSTSSPAPVQGICFEKVDNGTYWSMIPHPDGSNRAFLVTQGGKIFIATLPSESGQPLSVHEQPFMDISDRVASGPQYGLVTLAFHPKFNENGRFFVSYYCDKTIWPDCAGTCACGVESSNCTIDELSLSPGDVACKVSNVVAEYSINSSSITSPSEAVTANSQEVRRIFTMGFPYSNHLGGQILFGPNDHYLYVMFGDGGSDGDPFNFAQNKKSLLGKMLRLDIDNFDKTQTLYGNYSIPPDNPFVNEPDAQSEIWAYGLRNPWRCNFDSLNPKYLYCADIGQETIEEVDLITKGGNYGWRVYEGNSTYTPKNTPGGNTSASSIDPIFPILQYTHQEVNPSTGSAAIIGGYVSRSSQDACLYGRYVYADVYGKVIWAAAEVPPGSGMYNTTKVAFACTDTPLECQKVPGKTQPNFQLLMSFGIDYVNNLYALDSTGVYRVTNPKICGFTCAATLPENAYVNFTKIVSATSLDSGKSSASVSSLNTDTLFWILVSIVSAILYLFL